MRKWVKNKELKFCFKDKDIYCDISEEGSGLRIGFLGILHLFTRKKTRNVKIIPTKGSWKVQYTLGNRRYENKFSTIGNIITYFPTKQIPV